MAVKRVPAITLQIWGSMLRPRGFELQHGKLVRSPSKSQNPPRPIDIVDESPTKTKGKGRDVGKAGLNEVLDVPPQRSVLATFRSTHSSASQRNDGSSHHRLFKRVPTVLNISDPPYVLKEHGAAQPIASTGLATDAIALETITNQTPVRAGLFAGLAFRTLGETDCSRVKTAIEEAGGRAVGEPADESVDFVIVRLDR